MIKKRCAICKKRKPLNDFYKDNNNMKDGKTSICGECMRRKNNLYHLAKKGIETKAEDIYKLSQMLLGNREGCYQPKRFEMTPQAKRKINIQCEVTQGDIDFIFPLYTVPAKPEVEPVHETIIRKSAAWKH